MAGLGIGPEVFALYRISDPEARAVALEEALTPTLLKIGGQLTGGLSRVVGAPMRVHPGKLPRRRGVAPEETFVAFCPGEKGYRGIPHLTLAVTRAQLHARVAVRAAADRGGAMRRTLQREAGALAKKGRPFRRLRSYAEWDFQELPEIAPAHTQAFWIELGEALARGGEASGGIDVGIAWTAEEARNLAIGDVLGTYRDLSPLYKLLAGAR